MISKRLLICFFLFFLMAGSGAWAQSPIATEPCNGTNEGIPCFSGRGLPGTCVNNGSTVDPGGGISVGSGGYCQENQNPDGTCTNMEDSNGDEVYGINYPEPGTGLVATIINDINQILMGNPGQNANAIPLSQQMFEGIVTYKPFQDAVVAAMTLYVIVYAISFTFGMVQLTVFDFFMRMAKIGVVALLLNGTAWGYFTSSFVRFFNDGTNDIITAVSNGIVSSNGTAIGGYPFDWMDRTIADLSSVKMMVTFMAAASTGPYGILVIALLTISLYTYVKAILRALWVYIMALVMRTLLFGLAPLFLACLMFTRTRGLFDGWLNQVVNSCLQPIFLFAFFSFFIQLIESVMEQIVNLDVCWTQTALFTGTASLPHYWRFAIYSCTEGIMVPFVGVWDFTGPVNTGCVGEPQNPVGIILPLTLWILTELAKRLNNIVIEVAKQISNASTDFRHMGSGFGGGDKTGGGGPGGRGAKPPTPPWAPPRAGPPSLKRGEVRPSRLNLPNQGRTAEQQRDAMATLTGRRTGADTAPAFKPRDPKPKS